MNTTEQQKKDSTRDNFDSLIHEAMDEVANKNIASDRSFHMPLEALYLVVLLLIVSLVYYQPYSTDTHTNPTTSSLESGKRVALLTLADDIDTYQRSHNKFPKKISSPLANVLKVEYEVLGTNHYQLIRPTPEGKLILDHQGTHEDIYPDDGE